MEDKCFNVTNFTINNFGYAILNSAPKKHYIINSKPCFNYLAEYLQKMDAETIIIENSYTDRDFSIDYSKYYVTCFQKYERICKRLHFFNINFSEEDFNLMLKDPGAAELKPTQLQDSYLGFIVIKPLPETFFGRICLKVWTENGRRQIFCLKPYIANLYGIQLNVESLAFQEQDAVTSKCSSIALWTQFQITSFKYQHSIPAPVEITESATIRAPKESRLFPHDSGLTLLQMAEAIRSIKLEPLVYEQLDEETLKLLIYAYVRSGIPIVMGYEEYENSASQNPVRHHTVTVAGYCLKPKQTQKFQTGDAFLSAYSIENIYVHDDQLGPFYPMEFKNETNFSIYSNSSALARVVFLLVAVPSQIRITLPSILNFISYFNFVYVTFLEEDAARLEWDIQLCDVTAFKKDILFATNLPAEDRFKILKTTLPKYMWRGRAFFKGEIFTDFIFDATDVEQGAIFLFAYEYQFRAKLLRLTLSTCVFQRSGLDKTSALVRVFLEKLNKMFFQRASNAKRTAKANTNRMVLFADAARLVLLKLVFIKLIKNYINCEARNLAKSLNIFSGEGQHCNPNPPRGVPPTSQCASGLTCSNSTDTCVKNRTNS